jgi:hypothetical protein
MIAVLMIFQNEIKWQKGRLNMNEIAIYKIQTDYVCIKNYISRTRLEKSIY